MRLRDSLNEVEHVHTHDQAHQLHKRIKHELDHGRPDAGDRKIARTALRVLEEAYPGSHEGRKAPERKAPSQPAHNERHHTPAPTPKASAPRAPTPRPKSPPRTRTTAPKAARQLSYQVNAATGGLGSVIGSTLVGALTLILLYLALTHTRAIARVETGTTTALDWLINPRIDPLRPTGSRPHVKNR